MISVHKDFQCRKPSQFCDEHLQNLEVRHRIAATLQEQHRDADVKEVLGTVLRRPAGSMKRETQEGDSPDSGQRAGRVRLGRHAAAERFPACNEGEVRRKTAHFPHRGAHGGMGHSGHVRALGASSMYGN